MQKRWTPIPSVYAVFAMQSHSLATQFLKLLVRELQLKVDGLFILWASIRVSPRNELIVDSHCKELYTRLC